MWGQAGSAGERHASSLEGQAFWVHRCGPCRQTKEGCLARHLARIVGCRDSQSRVID